MLGICKSGITRPEATRGNGPLAEIKEYKKLKLLRALRGSEKHFIVDMEFDLEAVKIIENWKNVELY